MREKLAMTPRELFEIARPCFHYAPRGTPDGAYFERSETGTLLMKAMQKIAEHEATAIQQERAAVVAWLRTFSVEGHFLADAIERCDHIKEG